MVRTADECDVAGARRLIGGRSFTPTWLTAADVNGVTPVMAALRSCCAELIGIILLHDSYDVSATKKQKQRRQLADFAVDTSLCRPEDMEWAIAVLWGVHESRPQQAELLADPAMAPRNDAWFLPHPGEWFAPVSLEEMGIVVPTKPELPVTALQTFMASRHYLDLLRMASPDNRTLMGANLDADELRKLWYLTVRHVQLPNTSAELPVVRRHMRSIGWTLFFRGDRDAMMVHYFVLELLSSYIKLEHIPDPEDEVHSHLDGDLIDIYWNMSSRLNRAWDRIGSWLS